MKYLTLLLMFPLFLSAQAKKEKATQEVAAKVLQLTKAMIDADSVAITNLAAEHLVYGHSLGAVEDRASLIHNLATGNSDFVTIDITDQTITISGNVAIVRHKFFAKTNDKGKPGEVRMIVMQIWQKQKQGDWKFIARQAVRPPQQ